MNDKAAHLGAIRLSLALCCALAGPGLKAHAQDRQPAEVTNIVDGDTIDVTLNGTTARLRYIGMDTPERGRPFFREATEVNRELVAGRTVYLEKDVSETDRYDRLLRYVYLDPSDPPAEMVNAVLVRRGYALTATYPPDVKHVELFRELQSEARRGCRGLWRGLCRFFPFVQR